MEGIGGVIRQRKSEHDRKKPSGGKGHLPGIEIPEARKERHIHSQAHALAAEISAHFKERGRFAAYLSVINRIGIARARTAFASITSGEMDVRDPRKFFMWLSKSAEGPRKAAAPGPEPSAGKQLPLFGRVAKRRGK